jgi:hypothetical protein
VADPTPLVLANDDTTLAIISPMDVPTALAHLAIIGNAMVHARAASDGHRPVFGFR